MGALDIMASVGGQLAGNAMGAMTGQNSMSDQVAAAKDLAVFNREQQMQLWRDTNYKAQADQMRKAGLNVGLMYGKGGGQGGSVATAGGQMPSGYGGNNSNPMEVAASLANLELMKANVRKTNAEAKVVEETGVEKGKAEINSLNANTGNAEADTILKGVNTEMARLQTEIATEGKQSSIWQLMANANKAIGEASQAMTKAGVDANTAETQVKIVEQNYANLIVQNQMMRMGIKLDAQKIEESKKLVEKMANDITVSKGQLNLNQWTEEVKANYPSVFNVLGGKVDQVIRTIQGLLSGGEMPTERKYK